MKPAPSCNYKKIDQRSFEEGMVTAWISRDAEDSCWDEFLKQTPLGQFQQSTIWARAKYPEGWRPVRVLFKLKEVIVGGFQVLERSSWWGKIGYVSKGPVILPNKMALADYAAEMIRKVAGKEGLWALIAQPPDLCEQMPFSLAAHCFMVNVLAGVNEATWINDLAGDFETVEQRMSKWTRKKIRQAKNRRVNVREGGRVDIGAFFELMLSTCQRQGVQPSPPDERTIAALWDAASPTGCIRLTFAECEGRAFAGLICILFGRTASLWKKGWTSSDGQLHPNELLTHEMLEWANSRGYQIADFTALDIEIAIRMFEGQALLPEQEQSRHMFNVRFGGRAMLLPEARAYFPNPVVRWAYRVVFHTRIARANEYRELVAQARRARGDVGSLS